MNITPLCLHGVVDCIMMAGFCQTMAKTVFPWKTGLAKIVLAGKNRFLPEYIFFMEIKCINFCLYLIE